MSGATFPIAYVAGQFPLRSETFVWREVEELRRRGWPVFTFGLHRPAGQTPKPLWDLLGETRFVYEGTGRLTNPLNRALPDMLFPGEPTGLRDRLKLPFQVEAGATLAGWLRDLGVRHVHAHFAHAPASVAMYAAADLGVPFSFTGHANDLFRRRQLLRRKLERAAFVACISDWHRNLYQSIHPGGRYEVIRCGVPMADYDLPPADGTPGRLRVLSVARLVAKKGLDTLVRAARGMEGVTVTVAGDGPMREELERLAGPNVAFAGAVDPAAVPGLLAGHDAFALPCRPSDDGDRDGIPVALMEAMAAARPAVAGDLPAVRELIGDGATGRLVPASADPAPLAAVLRAWRDDPGQRRRLGEAGRGRVAAEFSLAGNVGRLEAAFRAARGSRGSRG